MAVPTQSIGVSRSSDSAHARDSGRRNKERRGVRMLHEKRAPNWRLGMQVDDIFTYDKLVAEEKANLQVKSKFVKAILRIGTRYACYIRKPPAG